MLLVMLAAMGVGTVAFIAIFHPLERLWLPTRKRAVLVWLASIFVFALSVPTNVPNETASVAPDPPEVSDIEFEQVAAAFSVDSTLTNLQKDELWRSYEGECVEWTGELAHLDEAFFSGFDVGFKHLPTTFTYDVLISAPESARQELLEMQQGGRYQYRARLRNAPGAILPTTADWGC